MKTIVNTKNAPAAIGPYSQAVASKDLLFISGQLPIDPETGMIVDGDIQVQTDQSLKNMMQILKAKNLTAENILKTTVFLDNMDDFQAMNEIYNSFFPENSYPARSAVEVSRLPKGALVEIEAIAMQ